jgi:hypothetical protein
MDELFADTRKKFRQVIIEDECVRRNHTVYYSVSFNTFRVYKSSDLFYIFELHVFVFYCQSRSRNPVTDFDWCKTSSHLWGGIDYFNG